MLRCAVRCALCSVRSIEYWSSNAACEDPQTVCGLSSALFFFFHYPIDARKGGEEGPALCNNVCALEACAKTRWRPPVQKCYGDCRWSEQVPQSGLPNVLWAGPRTAPSPHPARAYARLLHPVQPRKKCGRFFITGRLHRHCAGPCWGKPC